MRGGVNCRTNINVPKLRPTLHTLFHDEKIYNSMVFLLFYHRSELKPVAAPASEDIPENQNQVVAERKKSGGASGISTLFVNLTRKPSRVARNFRKKSKAPPPPTSQPPSNPGPSTSATEEEGETKTGIFLRYIKRIFLCG